MGVALKTLLSFCIFFLAWILLVLILTAQQSYSGSPWSSSLVVSVQQVIPWFLASPLIILFSYWFPILYGRWWVNVVLHVVFCIIILVGVGYIRESMRRQWPHGGGQKVRMVTPSSEVDFTDPSEQIISRVAIIHRVNQTAPLGIPLYVTFVFLFSLMRYRAEISQRDQAALKLESQLTQTHLDLLKSQLQPHFLFNTLNSISTLIYSDPDKADSMVIQLSELLRLTLDQRNQQFISLEKELETLKKYLKIQSMRFGDRIVTLIAVQDDTLACQVPPMILMPLVENAVRYGVEQSSQPTTITIASSAVDGKLSVSVADDGPGINSSNESGTGVGLANIQSRLETHYPDDVTSLTLIEHDEGGVVASIELPIKTEPV